jgi:hypothetical protein
LRPLAIDLFCGLGGWTEGLLAEGYDVVGFDIERHIYGEHRYPAQLVIQDVLTLHGSQFRDAALIVASPPCTEFSWMAMPWSRAKQVARALRGEDEFPANYSGSRTIEQLNELFDACFRIRREACEAAGRYIPTVVENVRGARPWVGGARWNCGSMYFWGDVPALMPRFKHVKVAGIDWSKYGQPDYVSRALNYAGGPRRRTDIGAGARFTSQDCGVKRQRWFNDGPRAPDSLATSSSRSKTRKAASAQIAKIPLPLSRWVAATYRP